jgi:hypothetical protein
MATMNLRLEYRHNNAYDTILLVDLATALVRSRWDATPKATKDFLDASQDAADWDDQHLIDDGLLADDFGDLLAWRQSGEGVQLSTDMVTVAERVLGTRDN